MGCSPICLCSPGSGRRKFSITCNELCLRIHCLVALNLYLNIKSKWQKSHIFDMALVDSRTCERCFSCGIYSWIIVIDTHGGKMLWEQLWLLGKHSIWISRFKRRYLWFYLLLYKENVMLTWALSYRLYKSLILCPEVQDSGEEGEFSWVSPGELHSISLLL